jgi:hypothetical protein
MTDISPAAQAVLDAFWNGIRYQDDITDKNIAAALRAAADQCKPEWLGLTCVYSFHAIADELEGADD